MGRNDDLREIDRKLFGSMKVYEVMKQACVDAGIDPADYLVDPDEDRYMHTSSLSGMDTSCLSGVGGPLGTKRYTPAARALDAHIEDALTDIAEDVAERMDKHVREQTGATDVQQGYPTVTHPLGHPHATKYNSYNPAKDIQEIDRARYERKLRATGSKLKKGDKVFNGYEGVPVKKKCLWRHKWVDGTRSTKVCSKCGHTKQARY